MSIKLSMLHPMFTRGRVRRSTLRLNHVVWTASCYRYAKLTFYLTYSCLLYAVVHPISCSLFVVFPIPCDILKKGAKEFVDQNMLRSQRSRRRRRQQRPTTSSCPGPSGSAEEGKEGDSDRETTSSSGKSLISKELGLEPFFKPPGALSTPNRTTKGVMEKVKLISKFLIL